MKRQEFIISIITVNPQIKQEKWNRYNA